MLLSTKMVKKNWHSNILLLYMGKVIAMLCPWVSPNEALFKWFDLYALI